MPIHIIRQDITKMTCDAIVNPSNEELYPGGGVAEAYYGMTEEQTEAALSRLDAPLREVAEAFRRRYRQDA